MARLEQSVSIERLEAPIEPERAEEFIIFWRWFFGPSDEEFRDVYTGKESSCNRDIVYLSRTGHQLVATAHLTRPVSGWQIAGVGGIATHPDFQGRGLAYRLCERLRNDFFAEGGKALCLGTSNPTAFRVYRRLGWRKLAGSHVMICLPDSSPPEPFLVNLFQQKGAITIAPCDSRIRFTMVPLIVAPHNWEVLDANVGIISTRYAMQPSCGGLYPKYEPFIRDSRCTAMMARAGENLPVGLATARIVEERSCHIDGFTHENFISQWPSLMRAVVAWGKEQHARHFQARLSLEDEEKISLFEGMHFRKRGDGAMFDLGDRRVPSLVMENTQ